MCAPHAPAENAVLPRTAAARMAAEVLKTCLDICKFFYDQKQLNKEAKSVLADLADYVMRLSQPLHSLNTRGLESAALQLNHPKPLSVLSVCSHRAVKNGTGHLYCKVNRDICTGNLRNVVQRIINRGSSEDP